MKVIKPSPLLPWSTELTCEGDGKVKGCGAVVLVELKDLSRARNVGYGNGTWKVNCPECYLPITLTIPYVVFSKMETYSFSSD